MILGPSNILDHLDAQFPRSESPSHLPPIRELVSSIPLVAGPSRFQHEHLMWAPLPTNASLMASPSRKKLAFPG